MLKDLINTFIEEKKNGIVIEKVMLSNLIDFFDKNVWYDGINKEEYKTNLHTIRNNRNIIHSFSGKALGNWMDLKIVLKFI